MKVSDFKRNQLISLIRKLGKLVKEDPQFTEEYAKEQAFEWQHDLDVAIKCFQNLIKVEESKNERM